MNFIFERERMVSFLGKGAYGQVHSVNGVAIKQFNKLSHIIQEYMALLYLHETNNVVKTRGVDFNNLELKMELYDCNFRSWLNEKKHSSKENHKILKDILIGLSEIHDRNLAHGDLKPGNILIRRNPLEAVLGDCGFTSISKYTKANRTAPRYREPNVKPDRYHDIFSFGIILLEISSGASLVHYNNYNELKRVVINHINGSPYKSIILRCIHEDRSKRPSARTLLKELYDETISKWRYSTYSSGNKYPEIRELMKTISIKSVINRRLIGYNALCNHLDRHQVNEHNHTLYSCVTLMILSSIFGSGVFNKNSVIKICGEGCKVIWALEQLLNDQIFVDILFEP
jgi:serine/threonine protein kinase